MSEKKNLLKHMGKLRNGNLSGDPSKAPRCLARAKSTQLPCRAPAMLNGRCRLHGGKSTGPVTPEGLTKSRMANWKHGKFTKEALAEKKAFSKYYRTCKATLADFKK